jgi:hypothetical protein
MTVYAIRIKGHFDQHWSLWLDGMAVEHEASGETLLAGPLMDQAALYSLLIKIHSLNLTLISVVRIETASAS